MSQLNVLRARCGAMQRVGRYTHTHRGVAYYIYGREQ